MFNVFDSLTDFRVILAAREGLQLLNVICNNNYFFINVIIYSSSTKYPVMINNIVPFWFDLLRIVGNRKSFTNKTTVSVQNNFCWKISSDFENLSVCFTIFPIIFIIVTPKNLQTFYFYIHFGDVALWVLDLMEQPFVLFPTSKHIGWLVANGMRPNAQYFRSKFFMQNICGYNWQLLRNQAMVVVLYLNIVVARVSIDLTSSRLKAIVIS